MTDTPTAVAIAGPIGRPRPSVTATIGAVSGILACISVISTLVAYNGWVGDDA